MDFSFYQLAYNPFIQQSRSPVFWSPTHYEAWQGLLEGVERRHGFVFILGQSGLGKTVLCRTYINQSDPEKLTVLHGIDAALTFPDMLAWLLSACGLDGATDDLNAMTDQFRQFLIREDKRGRHVVLLIDEAHALSTHALQNLSLLSELMHDETGHLLQVVLFGRPSLVRRQDLPTLQAFQLGLARATELAPLTREQSVAYIEHHLKHAATAPSTIFSRSALNLIVTHARGVPKVINIMCTDVLVAGLLQTQKPIPAKTVRGVIGDVAQFGLAPWLRWSLVGAAAVLLVFGLWRFLPSGQSEQTVQAVVPTTPVTVVQNQPDPSLPAQARKAPDSLSTPGGALPSQPSAAVNPITRRHHIPEAGLPIPTPFDFPLATTPSQAGPTPETKEQMVVAQATATPKPGDPLQATLTPTNLSQPTTSPPKQSNGAVASDTSGAVSVQDDNQNGQSRMICVMPRQGGKRGSDIVLVDHQEEGILRLIADGSQNMSPALSPDGTLLAYTSYREGTPNIYVRDLKTGKERQLTSGPWLALPGAWSPNGRYLALSQSLEGNYDIFIYDIQNQRMRRLTTHAAVDVSPSFAPDSNRLVFASDRTGAPQLYLTDVNGVPPTRLTKTGPYNTSPAWSPNNNTIAFIGRSADQALDIHLIQADGTTMRRLTRGQRFHTPPTWAPDGQVLMGMSLRGSKWEQHMVSLSAAGIAEQNRARDLFRTDIPCLAPQWVAQRIP